MAVILSFESARRRRETEARPVVNFRRLLINHTPPSAGFLGVFQAEPTSRAAALNISADLGITAEPYSLTLPQLRGFRLDAGTDAMREALKPLIGRSITRVVWRSPAQDLAWEGLPSVRGAVLNSLICLIQQLNGLDVPVWISEYVQISTGLTAQRASNGFSRLELTLR